MADRVPAPGRTPILRSLRLKVLIVTAVLLFTPLVFAFAWTFAEQNVESSLRESTEAAANEAHDVIAGSTGPAPAVEGRLSSIAASRSVRIRWVTQDGRLLVDADHQRQTDFVHRLGVLVFGDDRAPSLEAFDASVGAVEHRPEVIDVLQAAPDLAGPVLGCRTSVGSKLLMCHAVRRIDHPGSERQVVYVQQTARRALRALYDTRYQLIRLVLLLLPVALAFAWWMAGRVVRPIESLREQAMGKAASSRPEGMLSVRGVDEVSDLAVAFNALLGKLDDRRRENERFVADLVHEFKNPVSTVRACSETLASGHVDDVRAVRLSRMLGDASARLDTLVSEFLELARAEAGMPGETRGRFDLAALAEGVVEAVRTRHTEVAFHVESDALVFVHGVEGRFDSLLRNLLDNAAFFAKESHVDGGAQVNLRLRAKESSVILEVSDNGPGIEADHVPRVFDRFFTTRERSQGSGLGLSLVRAIAQAHGGTVEATSPAGEGATFRLRLPLADDLSEYGPGQR